MKKKKKKKKRERVAGNYTRTEKTHEGRQENAEKWKRNHMKKSREGGKRKTKQAKSIAK